MSHAGGELCLEDRLDSHVRVLVNLELRGWWSSFCSSVGGRVHVQHVNSLYWCMRLHASWEGARWTREHWMHCCMELVELGASQRSCWRKAQRFSSLQCFPLQSLNLVSPVILNRKRTKMTAVCQTLLFGLYNTNFVKVVMVLYLIVHKQKTWSIDEWLQEGQNVQSRQSPMNSFNGWSPLVN